MGFFDFLKPVEKDIAGAGKATLRFLNKDVVQPVENNVKSFVSVGKNVANSPLVQGFRFLGNEAAAITGKVTGNDQATVNATNAARANIGRAKTTASESIKGFVNNPAFVGGEQGITPESGAGLNLSELVKATTESDVKKILADKIPPEAVDKLAPAIVHAKDPNVIRNIIKGTNDIPAEVPQPSIPAPNDVKTAIDAEAANQAPLLSDVSNPNSSSPVDTSLAPSPIPEVKPIDGITNPDLKVALDNATRPTNVDINPDPNAKVKSTAQDIRTSYSGEKNRAILAGQQLADAVHKVAPGEEKGIFWYNEAKGDVGQLQKWADEASKPDSALAPHAEDINQALSLTPQAKEAASALTQYYEKAGQNAAEQGTIKGVIQDYGNNRLYQQEKTAAGVTGDLLKQTTGKAKSRVYDTVAEAVQNGKVPVTTDAADLAALHSSELARVNATRNLLDNLNETSLGKWIDPSKDNVPTGFSQVGNLRKGTQVFVAPEELAKKLKPITEPDFLSQVDKWRAIGKYQGLVKTVDLSYSLFHHLTEAAQFLYQTKLGYDVAKNSSKILNSLDSADFNEMEQNFAKYGGITAKVEGVQDIVRNLVDKPSEGLMGKIENLPGPKQFLQGAQKSSEFLFGKAQRWLKVNDFQTKAGDWLSKHPEATDSEFKTAMQGYAKEINAAYGGLNWEAIGVTKTAQSVLRGVLLAPDWVISNLELAKYGLGKGTAGQAARSHLFTALASGMVATEVLNKSITGHFTNENPKGHEFEVQVAPNVYVSVLRGGIGDLLKLAGNIQDSGSAQGIARFAQGKLSPLARTTVGLLSGTQFTGQKINGPNDSFAQKSLNEAKFIAQSAAPLPFGVSTTAKYVNEAKKTGQPVNPYVTASLATGVARYTKTNNALSDKQNATISAIAKEGGTKDQQKAYEQFYLTSKKTSKDRTTASKAIDTALSHGDTAKAQELAKDYNKKYAQSFKDWSAKFSQYGDKTLTKEYNSNKINLTPTSIKARVKSLKTNPLYGGTP